MIMRASIKQTLKGYTRSLIPLSVRKRLAVWLYHQKWLNYNRRSWWSQELIQDLAALSINDYHKFLWSNHLAYSAPYEVSQKFGNENMQRSRMMFFSDLTKHLVSMSVNPATDIHSVFEVGCSLGYLLRYCETDIFPSATDIGGSDIDQYAIRVGSEYLRSVGSNIQLKCGDMEDLNQLMKDKVYDVIICPGVLMYLHESAACRLVDVLLRHTGVMLAMTGLAHPDMDNAELQQSVARERDQSFIHNFDFMINKAGGQIVARRWEGSTIIDGHSIYFVFAINRKG